MTDDRQQRDAMNETDKFVRAIHWENEELASELGMQLTAAEMHEIKDALIYLWVQDKLPVPYVQRLVENLHLGEAD